MKKLSDETQTADERIAELEKETLQALSGETPESPETSSSGNEATASEETQTAAESEVPAESKETNAAETNTDEKEPLQVKPKGEERIQTLANERNEFKSQADKVPDLEKEIARLRNVLGLGATPPRQASTQPMLPQNKQQQNPGLPWNQPADGQQQELTEEQLTEKIRAEVQTGATNQRIMDTLNYDIATTEDQFPELREGTKEDPNPEYDPKLATTIAELYQLKFEKDHSLRFIDFVNDVMALKQQGMEKGKKLAQQNAADVLRKQAAEDVIDPSGSTDSQDQSLETRIKSAKNSKDLAELEKLLPHS